MGRNTQKNMTIKKNTNTKYTSSTYRKNRDNKRDPKPLSNSSGRTSRQPEDSQRSAHGCGRDTRLGKVGIAVGAWSCPYGNGDCSSDADKRDGEMKILMKLTSLSIISLVLLFFYWSFWPFNPVQMETPIKILTKQVVAGQTVVLDLNFNKRSDCTPEIKWYLVNGFVLRLSDSGVKRPQGQQSYAREIVIPESAPTHKVHIRAEYSCRVNPLRVIEYSWDTEEFEIVKKE